MGDVRPAVDDADLRSEIGPAAVRLAVAIYFVDAGIVEFLMS